MKNTDKTPKNSEKRAFSNLLEVTAFFADNDRSKAYLEDLRWGGKITCPHCANDKIYTFAKRFTYKCAKCRKPFSVTKGTIFENSALSLQKWFAAVYLLTSHKKGISSMQLSKDLGITQKSAWFVLQRIRFAMRTKSFNAPLTNTVEIDETFVGGKNKNRHANKKVENSQGRSVKDKVAVLGIIERGGELRAGAIRNTSANSLTPIILGNVSQEAKVVTDEWTGYNGLSNYYDHSVVNHGRGEYVTGNFHTNTIEGFWSLLKRGLVGIYHQVSPKHIDRYITEFAYRYNTKEFNERGRFDNAMAKVNCRLTYDDLIK